MAIYDFQCRNCKCEFTLTGNSDEEIRDTFCVECQSEDWDIVGYNRNDDDILAIIMEKLAHLEKAQRKIEKALSKVSKPEKVTGYVC